MKLLRLKLNSAFRSLAAGFEIHFIRDWNDANCLQFHPYCLVGRNGSGKSNVLEAIAAIFYHIECIYLNYRPDGFEFNEEFVPDGFRAEVCTPDAFELEYCWPIEASIPNTLGRMIGGTRVSHIRIIKVSGQRPILHTIQIDKDGEQVRELNRDEVDYYLPKYILGYSSGRNEILSLPFFKMRFIHFDEYRDHLVRDLPYPGRPEGRLIYLDEAYSQAILLCHFLFPSKGILEMFSKQIDIRGIERFRIIIRKHYSLSIPEERYAARTSNPQGSKTNLQVELTSQLTGFIDKLIACSTSHYYEEYDRYTSTPANNLYLDYWVNEATQRAFRVHFGESIAGATPAESEELSIAASAINFFQSLQMLLTLNLYKVSDDIKFELYQSDSLYVNETIPLPASEDRIIRFKEGSLIKNGVSDTLYIKSLSDGEYQFLHTIGLCLLFRYEATLFLLDEPETHLNPGWRASYISTLRSAFGMNSTACEVLLTSHSPFIVSDCKPEKVLVFTKDTDTQHVTCTRPDFNTFGASVNAITMKVFGQKETIGDFALSTLVDLRKRLDAGEEPDRLIDEAGRVLGDSVEKVLFANQALTKKDRR